MPLEKERLFRTGIKLWALDTILFIVVVTIFSSTYTTGYVFSRYMVIGGLVFDWLAVGYLLKKPWTSIHPVPTLIIVLGLALNSRMVFVPIGHFPETSAYLLRLADTLLVSIVHGVGVLIQSSMEVQDSEDSE